MSLLVYLIVNTLAVFVTAYILPGVRLDSVFTALVVSIVLGIINSFLKPILLILTLPLNILTLGLFTFVIMALCVMLAGAIVPGFYVGGFWWAMVFAVVLAIINMFLESVL